MANIKLTGNTWDTSGIYDATQQKTQAAVNADVSELKTALMPTVKSYPPHTKEASGTEFSIKSAELPIVDLIAEEPCSIEFTGKNVMNPVPVGRSKSNVYNVSVGGTIEHGGVDEQYYTTDGETTECNIGSTTWMMLVFASAPLKAGKYRFSRELAFVGQDKLTQSGYITDSNYVVKQKLDNAYGNVTTLSAWPEPRTITVEDGDRFVQTIGNHSSGATGKIFVKFQLERGEVHTEFEKYGTPQTFTISDVSDITLPSFNLFTPTTFVYATKNIELTYYDVDEVADVWEKLTAYETVYRDIADSEHNLLNYGYDIPANYVGETDWSNSETFSVYRNKQLIRISNPYQLADSVKIKVSGDVVRGMAAGTVRGWTGGYYFKAGHTYQITLQWISGTIIFDEGDQHYVSCSVYKNGESSTIGSGSYDADSKTYTRIVSGDDSYANIIMYFPANVLCTDAVFIMLMKDITDNSVQEYYREELVDTVAKVRNEITSPSMVFLWATDIHRHSSNAEGVQTFAKMIENMSAVSDAVPCSFILDTGDLTDGNTIQATTLSRAYNCLAEFRSIGLPYVWAMGNHDTNPYVSGQPYLFTMDECYKAYYPALMDVVSNVSESGTDYYVDFNGLDVRLISLNANNVHNSVPYAFSENTATWLGTALDTQKTVFVVLHQSPYTAQVYNNTSTTNSAAIRTALETFVNNGGNLIMLSGHSHRDVAFIDPFLSIMQCCQRFTLVDEDTVDEESGMTGYIDVVFKPARESGTATEDCWSVGVYKPFSNDLSLIRFGAGKDRYFHATPIAPTTVTTKLTGTITWSSSDTSVATVSSGVITGVATGKCAVLAKDETGNYECWIVEVT